MSDTNNPSVKHWVEPSGIDTIVKKSRNAEKWDNWESNLHGNKAGWDLRDTFYRFAIF